MHVVYAHCCGLDVHKRSITACLLLSEASGKGHHEVRRFGTMTRDLLEHVLKMEQLTLGDGNSSPTYVPNGFE